MKTILSVLALFLLAFTPQAIAETMTKANTTVVAFHADWCGGCKILGPKVKEVMNTLDADTKAKLAMVKFDFTDDTTKAASKALAKEKGISDLYPTGKPSTGILKVLDTETGAVLAKIHYKMSAEEIKGTLKAIAARS